jgi:hypothetical protein
MKQFHPASVSHARHHLPTQKNEALKLYVLQLMKLRRRPTQAQYNFIWLTKNNDQIKPK